MTKTKDQGGKNLNLKNHLKNLKDQDVGVGLDVAQQEQQEQQQQQQQYVEGDNNTNGRGTTTWTLTSFDAAMDEYYSRLEEQRLRQDQRRREQAVLDKLDRLRHDQHRRVDVLASGATEAERRALAIERNLDDVDAALRAVNAALAGGLDWDQLRRMIDEERAAGNPIAQVGDG